MDKVATYRKYVQQLVERYATSGTPSDEIEREMIIDMAHDHYQVMNVGWRGEHRIYGCVMHFDIKNGKVWIQQNGTEIDVAEELMHLGVLRNDIVLGFQNAPIQDLRVCNASHRFMPGIHLYGTVSKNTRRCCYIVVKPSAHSS